MEEKEESVCIEMEVTEDLRLKGMCRVCGSTRHKLMSIFGSRGTEEKVVDMIHTYLPILVTPEDLLPIAVCRPCVKTLAASSALVETCIKADQKMREMLNDIIFSSSKTDENAGSIVAEEVEPSPSSFSIHATSTDVQDPSEQERLFSRLEESGEEGEDPQLFLNQMEETSIQVVTEANNQDGTSVPLSKHKLYRCLHCDVTDTDAYSLLLHQVKAHPGNLMKCSKCDFACSSDQKDKFSKHALLHQKDSVLQNFKCGNTSLEPDEEENVDDPMPLQRENWSHDHSENLPELWSVSVSEQNSPEPSGPSGQSKSAVCFEQAINIEIFSEVRAENEQPCIVGAETSNYSISNHLAGSSNKQSVKITKNEVYWRCGFCGMRAKSKGDLNNHCALRHKERLGPSFVQNTPLQCFRCKTKFSSELWMKDHVCRLAVVTSSANIPSRALSCLSCPEVFHNIDEFRQHLASHTNSVKCTICGTHFRSQENLNTHMQKHKKKPSFQCPHCPRVFRLRSRLRIHERSHTGETPYMCVQCGKRFSTDCGFRLHMAAHEGKKPYVCALCGQTFNRPSNLKRHEGSCGSEIKLKCRICPEEFSKREDLNCHRAMHTKEEKGSAEGMREVDKTAKEDKFSCKVCDKKFDRVVDLFQHREETHTLAELEKAKKEGRVDGGAHICLLCGKELYNKRTFKRHMQSHSGEAQFHCNVCSNVYSTKFALEYHILTHTGERPFQCDVCSEGFKSSLGLRVHKIKHTGEKPYKCRLCDMGFLTAQNLRRHLVIHSDVRMFSCDYCPATFKRKRTQVAHTRIHTGEKPFACQYCGKQFTQRGTCSQHEKSHTDVKPSSIADPLSIVQKGMTVAIIKNWKGNAVQPLDQLTADLEVLVSQGNGNPPLLLADDGRTPQLSDGLEFNHSAEGGIQHMVLIDQHAESDVDQPKVLEINEHMVLMEPGDMEGIEVTHAIIVDQDGMQDVILADSATCGLKDASSDPQMPILDE